jgi:hypothetical protein
VRVEGLQRPSDARAEDLHWHLLWAHNLEIWLRSE